MVDEDAKIFYSQLSKNIGFIGASSFKEIGPGPWGGIIATGGSKSFTHIVGTGTSGNCLTKNARWQRIPSPMDCSTPQCYRDRNHFWCFLCRVWFWPHHLCLWIWLYYAAAHTQLRPSGGTCYSHQPCLPEMWGGLSPGTLPPPQYLG